MAEEQVEVPIVDTGDKPIEVTVATPKATGAAKIVTEDEGIESLKEQAARAQQESQRRLNDAQRQINEASARAIAAEREVVVTRKDTVSTVIDSLNKDKAAAKQELRTAHEAGDFEKVADAQDRLSMANARLVEAERGKLALEEEIQRPAQRQEPVYADPVESLIRNARLSQRSADWVRAHPEYATDPRRSEDMTRAHYAALAEGAPIESDQYFAIINERLGVDGGRRVESRQPQERSRTPTSAPVGRDMSQNPRRPATTPSTITLSPDEVKAALAINLDPKLTDKEVLERYAKNKLALIQEGNPSYTGNL